MGTQGSGRECVFCGEEIEPGAPPEHVLPQWMAKFRPKGMRFHHIWLPEHHSGADYPARLPAFSARKMQITADTICGSCNHGWMSDLETWSAPYLTPMIEGESQGLSSDTQALLAQWITKTALTWDQSQPPENRRYPLELCRHLWQHRLPPPGCLIRLGCFPGNDANDFVQMTYHSLIELPPDNDVSFTARPDAHRATIRIGDLVIEFTVADSDPRSVLGIRAGSIDPYLVTIWPSVEVASWPPQSFDADTFQNFIDPSDGSRDSHA